MTQNILFQSLILMLALGVAPLYANENMSVDDKIQKMDRELDLSDDQVEQIRPILEEYKGRLEGATGDEKERLKDEKHDRIKAVLTSDQSDQFDQMKADKENRSY